MCWDGPHTSSPSLGYNTCTYNPSFACNPGLGIVKCAAQLHRGLADLVTVLTLGSQVVEAIPKLFWWRLRLSRNVLWLKRICHDESDASLQN